MLFESKFFSVRQDDVRLPSGNEITYSFVEHPGFVVVVPVLPSGDVLLIRIFRYTVRQEIVECPAGGLDGDDPEVAASRELLEETGFRAGSLKHLGSFFSSTGTSNGAFHVYLASEL